MKTNLKNKWRLPTKEEFEKVLYPNKDKIPNLEKDSSYWSSSENYYGFAWYFSFYTSVAFSNYKYFPKRVRAVRDISNDPPNLSNSTIIGNLEVYNEDLGRMSWYEAIAAVDKLNDNIKI
jgi:hypothetical protein